MVAPRAMPRSFKKVAPGKTVNWLRKHYNAGERAVVRWLATAGIPLTHKNQKLRNAPDDFVEIAKTKYQYELAEHYDVTLYIIQSWVSETGAECKRNRPPPANKKPIPDDFATVAPTMNKSELRRHYKCSLETLNRWLYDAQVNPAEYKPQFKTNFHRVNNEIANRVTDMRKHTQYDIAADIMRRERWLVYPCDGNGKYTRNGPYWKVGNYVLTGQELLEKSEKYRRKSDDYW